MKNESTASGAQFGLSRSCMQTGTLTPFCFEFANTSISHNRHPLHRTIQLVERERGRVDLIVVFAFGKGFQFF
jgi:hypothetical protein